MIDAKGRNWRRCGGCGWIAWSARWQQSTGCCGNMRRELTAVETAAFALGGHDAAEAVPLNMEEL